MNFKKLTIALALLLTFFAFEAQSHECPAGTVQVVILEPPCDQGSKPACEAYSHYCIECDISYDTLAAVREFTIVFNSNCELSCISSMTYDIYSRITSPLFWQYYGYQLCPELYSGVLPCTQSIKKEVTTYYPLCWTATLEISNPTIKQYKFTPCTDSPICAITWEVCWNTATNSYIWTYKQTNTFYAGTACSTKFTTSLLPTVVGATSTCFYFINSTCN